MEKSGLSSPKDHTDSIFHPEKLFNRGLLIHGSLHGLVTVPVDGRTTVFMKPHHNEEKVKQFYLDRNSHRPGLKSTETVTPEDVVIEELEILTQE